MRAVALSLAALAGLAITPAADARVRALQRFPSCRALLGYARVHSAHALRTGWPPTPMTAAPAPSVAVAPTATGAKGEGVPAAAQDGTATDFSATNVQEQGVDEPDVVKTDGTTLFAVANGVLHAVDARAPTPALLDTLTLDAGWGHELLLH